MPTFRQICFYTAVVALVSGLTIGLLDIWDIIDVESLTLKIFLSSSLLLVTALLGLLVDRLFGSRESDNTPKVISKEAQ